MIFGWKNDPRWVEYYERRAKGRLDRMVSRQLWDMKIKSEIEWVERNPGKLMIMDTGHG